MNPSPVNFDEISCSNQQLVAQQINNMSKKMDFVESLVEITASIIDSIWKTRQISIKSNILPLGRFIKEMLKRSKSSFSTLRLALFYLIRLRNQLQSVKSNEMVFSFQCKQSLFCGRRMFLTALITSSKYLQDKNYSNKAWSKISGLAVSDINDYEREFLKAIDYRLFVPQKAFLQWSFQILNAIGKNEKARDDFKMDEPKLDETTSISTPISPHLSDANLYQEKPDYSNSYPSPALSTQSEEEGESRKRKRSYSDDELLESVKKPTLAVFC